MTHPSDAELREVLALSAKATPGPWTVHTQLGLDDLSSPDTAFVLAARDGWPGAAQALLDARAALREVHEHLEDLAEAWRVGALSEHDGLGGTRGNRNADLDYRIRVMLEET